MSGRQLNAPNVHYRSDRSEKASTTGKGGAWNLQQKTVYETADLSQWGVIVLNVGKVFSIETGLKNLKDQFGNLGMKYSQPSVRAWLDISRIPEPRRLTVLSNGFQGNKEKGIKFLLMVLDEAHSKPDIYSMIKYVGDYQCGMSTSCVLIGRNKFNGDSLPYYGNVAIKINLKMRGLNHILSPEKKVLGVLDQGDTMVVGIDVTHPPPGSATETPSIAGVVASCDKFYGRYLASIRLNPERQEQVDYLRPMMEERLEAFKKFRQKWPKNILVYRDGVGEGQYAMVRYKEGPAIDAAIQAKCPGAKVTIVIVGKRHHTRFFDPANGNISNPPPGTLVDTDVTIENGFDFFLQAHAAIKGTAKPAHYIVVRNDMNLSANMLQTIVSPTPT